MADNIQLSAGSGGAVLATDEVTRATVVQHAQYVKLMNGTDAAIDVIPGDATNGLDVDVTRVQGTVAVTQSGTWTVQPGNTPNTTAWLVTGTGGTFPITNAALSVTGGGLEASALRVTLANDSTGLVSVDDNGGSLTVDGTITANLAAGTNNIGDVDVLTLPALPAGTNNIGDVDVVSLPALPAGTNNIGDIDVLSIAAGDNNIGNVDIVTMPNVTLAAGTNTNEVVGDAAHDAAIAGNPVRIGLRAMSADYAAVASGDTADALASLTGKQVVLPYAVPAATWSYASPAAVTGTADNVVIAAGAVGVRHYITGVQVFNGHDTVGTEVVIKDGATVLWRGWAEQTGGGCSARFDPPLRGTAATAVNVANITTGSSTYFNLQGYDASE